MNSAPKPRARWHVDSNDRYCLLDAIGEKLAIVTRYSNDGAEYWNARFPHGPSGGAVFVGPTSEDDAMEWAAAYCLPGGVEVVP